MSKNIHHNSALTSDQCHLARYARFDGMFFTAVKTTGIFCRPSCPSPVAHEKNVVYFDTVFEAIEQGFRPCHRCRPDVAVDYYNGNIEGNAIVRRALQKIYNGFLNYYSIPQLARKLLISERHLRKLFIDNLGVPPVKIAKYHRAIFAKKLLISSKKAITEIAFAAGFKSLRQFNDIFKEVFGQTPTMLRKEFIDKNNIQGNATLLLKYNKTFDFEHILSFMRPRVVEGVEVVSENSYSRTFRTKNDKGYFQVQDRPGKSSLELLINCEDIRTYMEIYNRVREMFDFDTNFTDINKAFAKDKILSKGMKDSCVPRLPKAFNPFEFSIRAILGQQISVKAASTLAGRFIQCAKLECPAAFPVGLNYFSPNPSEVLKLRLDNIGLSEKKRQTIKAVASAVFNKDILLTQNQIFDEFHKDFIKINGIGDWTVNYVAMRGLGMIDTFPVGDLGIVRTLSKNGKTFSNKEILKIAEKWLPYRSYAALCLWNYDCKE